MAAASAGATRRRSAPPAVRAVGRSVWTWIVVGSLAVAAVVIGATGGWARVSPDGLARIPAGSQIALGPYDVAVHGWTISDTFLADELGYVEGADSWVVISLDITASPPRSSGLVNDSIRVQGLEPLDFAKLYNRDDGSSVYYLHPGVKVPVFMVLPVSEAQVGALGPLTTLPLILSTHRWSQHALSDEWGWWRSQVRASLQLPRDDTITDVGGDA